LATVTPADGPHLVAPVVSLTVTPSSMQYGSGPWSTTLTMSGPADGPVPTGSASWTDNGNHLCGPVSVSTAEGVTAATCGPIGGFPAGTYDIVATYSGDANYATGSDEGWLTVQPAPTAVTVTSSINPSVYGQATQVQAYMTPSMGGFWHLRIDGAPDPGQGLQGSMVEWADVDYLPAGHHDVEVDLTPGDDADYTPSSASIDQVVMRAHSTTDVKVHAHRLVAAVSVVAPGDGTPTGIVRFTVKHRNVGHATLSNGLARLHHKVAKANRSKVVAHYVGDHNVRASRSAG
jgi:hypothetical protein